MFEKLATEGRNPATLKIDRLSTLEMLKQMNHEDQKVPLAVADEIPNIAKVIDVAAEKLKQGGRIIYVGAGSSGRLGILDAAECPPTYGTSPERIQGLIAGGKEAMFKAVEGAEDNRELGMQDLRDKKISKKDVIIGIAASGRTPYVLAALKYAKETGAYTVGISCNSESEMQDLADVVITLVVGPEVVMGSTRMKAGTAQKLVLNMISTGTMIKLGKVYSNLMVDVQATNEKLLDRANRIVKLATKADDQLISETLATVNYNVKLAILIILTGLNSENAAELLKQSEGYIAKALENKGMPSDL